MNGFLLIDKPKGITSYGVVAKIKKELNIKKCGHTGTLDPNATGLLVVAVGEATKVIRLLAEHQKLYEATILFGYDSNTLDCDGTITNTMDMQFNEQDLDLALKEIKNQTQQIPPMVSAIKIAGKKLYEYERKHQTVELEPRDIRIFHIQKISPLKEIDNHLEIDLSIECSKGFYVRSFARDLGIMLKGCAIIKELRRVKSGNFHVKDATTLEQFSKAKLYSIEEILPFQRLEVNSFVANLARNGVTFDERQIKTDEPFYVVMNHVIIALYEPVKEYVYKPVVIFK